MLKIYLETQKMEALTCVILPFLRKKNFICLKIYVKN